MRNELSQSGISNRVVSATCRVLSLCASSIDEGLDATLDGRAAAMILNSLSKARSSDARVFASISQVILALGDGHVSLGGQNVGLILNAFSKAGKTDAGLFAFLSRQAQALPTADVDAQALSNILNAFANANIKDEALLKHMAGVACAIPLASYSSQVHARPFCFREITCGNTACRNFIVLQRPYSLHAATGNLQHRQRIRESRGQR